MSEIAINNCQHCSEADDKLQEADRENKRLRERIAELEGTLTEAVECVDTITGSCPADMYSWDNNCAESCDSDCEKECWWMFFEEKAREKKSEKDCNKV